MTAATDIDTDAIHTSAAVWAANMAKIGDLMRERDPLRIRAEAAEGALRLYRAELLNAEVLRRQLVAEIVELRFSRAEAHVDAAQRPSAVIIPIREVVG